MARPVDGMFRAGQISSKEWARLHPNEHGGGKGSQKSKMAKFEHKAKDEGGARENKAVSGTRPGHIDGPDQGRSAAGAFSAPTRGGGVHGHAGKAGHIDTHQKPNFPGQGPGRAHKSISKQQPSSSNFPAVAKGDNWYGSSNSRHSVPSRLKPAATGGSKF